MSLNYENFFWLDLDPVRESVNRATGAMLTTAGHKPTAEVIPHKQARG
jgi:hypothetical protein